MQTIELKSDDFEVWSNKGFVHCKLGGFDEALGALEKALELKPDEADIWSNKGVIFDIFANLMKRLKHMKKRLN